ncbi:MAG: hypothetical protein KGL73_03380 [Burkholderiales bacterium]|nr:hypothetical protein [Burkholderiales bacterium]
MPPSIVITEPVPRWKAWARYGLRAGFLVLLCAFSFYAGVRYERRPQAAASAITVASDVDEAGQAPALPIAQSSAPTVAPADTLAPLALDGLQIQSLDIAKTRAGPGELAYEFVVANEGRAYEGNFEFLVRGVQDGREVQWVFPPENQRSSGAYRLLVSRYLKMNGKIQLPMGLAPQAVALSLREPTGVRASRGVTLPE